MQRNGYIARLPYCLLTLFVSTVSHADVGDSFFLSSRSSTGDWHPVISVLAGSAITQAAGESNSFPIKNPTTDLYYNYYAARRSQTASLMGAYLGAEHLIAPDWFIGFGIGYNQTGEFPAKGDLSQGADPGSQDNYTYQYKITSKQFLLQAEVLYNYQNLLLPYFLVGAGLSINDAYQFSTDVPPDLTFTRNYTNENNTTASYTIGIGVDTYITESARIGLGYRYANLGKVKLGGSRIDNINVTGTLIQSNLYANEIYGQLTWVF